jgi:TM2 domain-containing membrane protein YozV
MFSKSKSRKIAAVLALTGILIPISGWHKFYLGQPFWGIVYLLLSWTPIPHVASAMELVWYLVQDEDEFGRNFTLGEKRTAAPGIDPTQVSAIAEALRQLEQLRQDGLISEYEFEQKRRQWLDRMI